MMVLSRDRSAQPAGDAAEKAGLDTTKARERLRVLREEQTMRGLLAAKLEEAMAKGAEELRTAITLSQQNCSTSRRRRIIMVIMDIGVIYRKIHYYNGVLI